VSDPFQVLGLPATATLDDVRAARRRLARSAHPDVGGDERRMREINQAFDQAVRRILGRPDRPSPVSPPPAHEPADAARPAPPPPFRPHVTGTGPWVQHDEPSFTIDVLPVDAFAALERVATRLGEIVAEDPPYVLELILREPARCWCRLELLPEAGATTVMMTVAGIEDRRPPIVEDVRDAWIDALNMPV
jgi:hypothetical protein